jgi:hypothetical protein
MPSHVLSVVLLRTYCAELDHERHIIEYFFIICVAKVTFLTI